MTNNFYFEIVLSHVYLVNRTYNFAKDTAIRIFTISVIILYLYCFFTSYGINYVILINLLFNLKKKLEHSISLKDVNTEKIAFWH